MTRFDRIFAAFVVGMTILVPGGLALLAPFDVSQERMGMAAGWGVALFVMIPSYVLVSRAAGLKSHSLFIGSFLGSAIGRMAITLAAIGGFHVLVPNPPMEPFLLTFFLGYFSLSAVKIVLTLGVIPGSGRSA